MTSPLLENASDATVTKLKPISRPCLSFTPLTLYIDPEYTSELASGPDADAGSDVGDHADDDVANANLEIITRNDTDDSPTANNTSPDPQATDRQADRTEKHSYGRMCFIFACSWFPHREPRLAYSGAVSSSLARSLAVLISYALGCLLLALPYMYLLLG